MPIKAAAIIILLPTLFFAAGCSNSHMYYSEAQDYVKAIDQEMARNGLPPQGKVFFEAGGWKVGPFQGGGVFVNTYEVMDRSLANRLVDRVRETHALYPEVPVTITVYSSAHTANHHFGNEAIVARVEVR